MKRIALSIAVVLAASGAALASGQGSAGIDFSSLSPEQLDALTNILAGLPRQ